MRSLALALVLMAPAQAADVVAAERAFAAAAARDGQRTAFRAKAAPDALMFVPGPVEAQTWLARSADPQQPVRRWRR